MKRPLFKPKSSFKPKFFVFKPKLLTLLISSILSSSAFAGQVYSGVDYQYFRDFAENKGKFTPGAQNIAVVNKKGESIGTMMQNVPMMDFSVVSRNGVAALVGDQYIVSVAHNVGYRNVDFGMEGSNPDQHRFGYNIVKRNNYKNDRTHPYMTDYHNPRLAKFVTEAAPIEMVSNMQGSTYGDLEKYPMRVRIGSGWQFLRDDNDNGNHIAMAYNYLTAGNTFMQGWANNGEVSLSGDVRHPNQYGPLPISGSSGDSGSPMFIYDKTAGKWLINGVLRSGHPYQGKENTYQIARKNYLDEIIAGDLLTVFDFTAASYDWTADDNGSGKLTKGSRVVTNTPLANYSLPSSGRDEFFGYGGPNPYMPALHHGKNIYFGNMENGTVTLKNNIDQGAGGLTFEGDFVVQPTTDETWKGAGVSVSEGSTVTWKVKNPAGDRLSKIGQGTLLVNGKGENLGDISVGDGVVVLNQQADEQGKKQAFNQLGIVSGRPTVKLESADQVTPNNIYFGFRGGRLDLNGHSLTFNRIQNTDEGAQIVNHNKDTAATVTLLGNAQIDNESKINQSKAAAFNGWFGETNAALHNGRLNIDYQPTHTDSVFLLSGGTNLNGNVTQINGTLVFSGRPTPHAYNHQNRPALIGRPQGEVVIDDDWLSRTFKAKKFIINGGSAVVSRNVSAINGDWQLSNNANAILGVTDKQANFICARSDWTGLTKCANQTLSDKVFFSIERSKINGNFTLNDNAKLSVLGLADVTGNVALQGQSQYRLAHNATQTGTLALKNQTVATVENATLAGDATLSDQAKLNFVNARFDHQIQGSKDTLVSLSDNANWTLPSSTTIGNLSLNNSQITLNPDFATQTNNQTFNQLTVLGDLSGNGTFNYRTYLQENKGDHVAVHGLATGNFVLNVRNTGAEPQTLQQLSLLTLKNTAQTDNVNVALANGTVDVGTYRYELKNDNHDYRLYNPRKEQELADQARLAEEKRKADEAARLAEEKRKAEEAARLAEEKRKADEAARLAEEKRKAEEVARLAEEPRIAEVQAQEAARLAEEKRKADEAARLAEEKRKTDEAARLAEEKRKADEATRLAEEARIAEAKAKAEELRLAEEQQKEELRLAEEKRKADETARLAEEKRKADEAARLAEEARIAEAQAQEAARLAEEKRKADEAARLAEEARIAEAQAQEAARLAEEKRKADEAARLAEEKRKADEAARLAEEARIAEVQAQEAARLAEEKRKADEAARLAEEKRKADEAARLAEEARIAEAQAQEAARLAEEKRKADEAARLAEEKRKAEEVARLAEEPRIAEVQAQEAARLAEEKRKADEAARLAEEKRKTDEAARLAEEKRKADEAARLAEEAQIAEAQAQEAARLAEEAQIAEAKAKAEELRLAEEQQKEELRLAEEKRKADEAARLAEEAQIAEAQAQEAARLAEEKRKAEEATRLAEEKHKADEAARLTEEKRKADEAARLTEEKRKADEAARLAEEAQIAEAQAQEAARLAEEKRKADEAQIAEAKAKAEELRLAEEQQKEELRLAEEKRKADEAARLTEEKRKADEAARLAEEARIAKAQAQEAARLAEEKRKADEAARLAEEAQIAEAQAQEAARLAEEKRKAGEAARLAEEAQIAEAKAKAEELRLAEEQQKEELRLAEEKRKADEAARLAEQARIAQAQEAARLAEEKRKAEEATRLAEEKRKADEAARLAEEKRKAGEAARLAEEAQIAEAKAKAEELRLAEEQQKEELRLAEEKRKADEAARLTEEKRKADEAARLAEEARIAKAQAQEAARLAEEKRKAEEAARLAEEARIAEAQAQEAARLAEEAQIAEAKAKAEELRLAEEQQKEELRLAEEKRKADEAARLAEEKRKADEAARLAEEAQIAEAKAKAEELRLAEEQQKEELRLAEEKRKAEEATRLAEEKRKADEAARLTEEKRKAEELRLAEEKRKADEAQIAEAQAQEAARLAEEKRKADEAAARLVKEQALLTTQHQSLQPKQKDLISRYANSALSELSSSLNGSLLIQNELNKHMFEQNSSYIWHNITEFSGRYHSDDFRDYQQKTHLNQLGLQHIQDNYHAGLLLSYARTKNEFDDDIHGKSRLNMVSAFTQSQFENGINMTLDASRGIHFSKIFGKTQDADIRRHITSLGVGFDYQFDLNKLSIQPNFSTHHYQFSGASYVYDQVQVHTPKNQFNVYQAGATLKYTFTPRDNLTITPQVSIHYLDVSNAKFTTQVNQAMLNQSLDSRWQKEIGLQASFGGWSFSAYAAQTQGKQQEKQHQAGLKVGVYW